MGTHTLQSCLLRANHNHNHSHSHSHNQCQYSLNKSSSRRAPLIICCTSCCRSAVVNRYRPRIMTFDRTLVPHGLKLEGGPNHTGAAPHTQVCQSQPCACLHVLFSGGPPHVAFAYSTPFTNTTTCARARTNAQTDTYNNQHDVNSTEPHLGKAAVRERHMRPCIERQTRSADAESRVHGAPRVYHHSAQPNPPASTSASTHVWP